MLKYGLFLLISSSAYAQSFDADVEAYAKKLKLPVAAIGVAKGDSLIYFKGIGHGNRQLNEPISPDHIFGIASVSKSISAFALQQAVSEGKLSWEDKIDIFPNRFFTTSRWTRETTLAHIVSHTSESVPIGSNFVYNGGKYNVALNAFDTLNDADNKNDITRRFTTEIESRVLKPLNMDHTVVRYDSVQYEKLKNLVAGPWNFDYSTGTYTSETVNIRSMQSGPGFGMMSCVRDLVKYSAGLNKKFRTSFDKISTPFYPGGLYGLGWFTSKFECIKITWVYGYGNTDSAIFLKIPEKDLTLIVLCGTSLSSASMRLGYGNPLNSPLVVSFLKNYVLNIAPEDTIDYQKSDSEISSQIRMLEKKYSTQIFGEELYAKASLGIFLPESLEPHKTEAERLLALYLRKPSAYFDVKNPLSFELIQNCKDRSLWVLGKKLILHNQKSGYIHPSIALYSGKILEKLGNNKEAISSYKTIADPDSYWEHGDKFEAMMLLARTYSITDTALSKSYLNRLINYKDLTDSKDNLYQEAKKMLEKN